MFFNYRDGHGPPAPFFSSCCSAAAAAAAAADFFTTAAYTLLRLSLTHRHTKGAHANNTLVFIFFNELKYIIG